MSVLKVKEWRELNNAKFRVIEPGFKVSRLKDNQEFSYLDDVLTPIGIGMIFDFSYDLINVIITIRGRKEDVKLDIDSVIIWHE